MVAVLTRREQETPYGDPTSRHMFRKPLVVTRGVLATFDAGSVTRCLVELQALAVQRTGLQYLQVFENAQGPDLWLIEDDQVVTALLPSEY